MKPRPPSLPSPPGYVLVPVQTTYLEMKGRPETDPIVIPPGCLVERWIKPDTKAYCGLFAAVGGEWGWSGRLIMKKAELTTILHAGTTEVYRLLCHGQVAGFAELDRSISGQAELTYFGLLPAFIGRGLGKFLLDWVVRRAWKGDTTRVWLHTCQFDHGDALSVYLKAGFRVYDEKIEMQPYAREFIARRRPAGN